jgi:transcriptional regulator with XRE-family HTH domain
MHGAAFRAYREALKMSQGELAKRMRVSRYMIARYEKGNSPIDTVTEACIKQLARDEGIMVRYE